MTGKQDSDDLVVAVTNAVLPLVDEQGEELKAGVSPRHLYDALAPILGNCTVADACHILPALRRDNSLEPDTKNGRRRSHARFEAMSMLEDFIAMAPASGPECVRARAWLLAEAIGNDGILGGWTNEEAAASLVRDIDCLIAGQFEGERFSDAAGKPASWWPHMMAARHDGDNENLGA
jgi:hypothetical protein